MNRIAHAYLLRRLLAASIVMLTIGSFTGCDSNDKEPLYKTTEQHLTQPQEKTPSKKTPSSKVPKKHVTPHAYQTHDYVYT